MTRPRRPRPPRQRPGTARRLYRTARTVWGEPYEPVIDRDTIDRSAWRRYALCAQVDPEIFFPDKGESARDAKRVCRSCEVRRECLAYALDNDERFGVFGGLSERERRKLQRQRRRDSAA